MASSVLVTVPAYNGAIDAVTAVTLTNLAIKSRERGVGIGFFIDPTPGLHTPARNRLAKVFRASGASHQLFLDSDNGIDASDVFDMLALRYPIVGALCFKKDIEKPTLCVQPLEPEAKSLTFGKDRTVRVKSIGTGVLLVARHVYDSLSPHVEQYSELHADGSMRPAHNFFPQGVRDGIYEGEDLGFSKLCREHDIPIRAFAPDSVTHAGRFIYSLATLVRADGSPRYT